MRQPVIAIDNVSAVYGRGARQMQALRGVTLSVQLGEVFGQGERIWLNPLTP
jgi:ABC-type dipeptide/oligopeptide/nickel transport system ATPase subunit